MIQKPTKPVKIMKPKKFTIEKPKKYIKDTQYIVDLEDGFYNILDFVKECCKNKKVKFKDGLNSISFEDLKIKINEYRDQKYTSIFIYVNKPCTYPNPLYGQQLIKYEKEKQTKSGLLALSESLEEKYKNNIKKKTVK